MQKWKKYFLIISVGVLVITPILYFTVTCKLANNFFKEQDLNIATYDFDCELSQKETLYLAYVKQTKLYFQERNLKNDILQEYIFNIFGPKNIDLIIFNSSVYIIFESDDNLLYLANCKEKIIKPLWEGTHAKLFINTNALYLCYLFSNTLFIHKFDIPNSQWIIDVNVNEFYITESEYFTYITYIKNDIIYYRFCFQNGFSDSFQFIAGSHPCLVPLDITDLNYLYYCNNNSLKIGYGVYTISHSKTILYENIQYISASFNKYKQCAIISFVVNNFIYLQEITKDEISDFMLLTEGTVPKILVAKNMYIINYRNAFNYYIMILNFNLEKENFFNIEANSLNTFENNYSNWIQNYNAYYTYVLSQNKWLMQGPVRQWFVEHPFETTVIMFFAILLIFGVLVWGFNFIPKLFSKDKEGNPS